MKNLRVDKSKSFTTESEAHKPINTKSTYLFNQIFMLVQNQKQTKELLTKIPETDFYYDLNAIKNSSTQSLMRRLIGVPLEKIPEKLRYGIASLLKKIRNPSAHLPVDLELNFKYGNIINNKIKYPNNKKYYIGLTHDVDNSAGYNFLEKLIKTVNQYKLKSTINILTHGYYKPDKSFLNDMKKDGFEIGLHGDFHDVGLAFRGYKKIKKRLEKSIQYLGFVPYGFRSPALSMSKDLFNALNDLGFLYDSTFQTGSTLYKSTEYPYVYQLYDLDLFEIPLFIQDDYFFREAHLSEKETLNLFIKLIKQMKKYSAAVVINLHPHIIKDKPYFFQGILEFIANEKDAYKEPLYKLVQFYKNKKSLN